MRVVAIMDILVHFLRCKLRTPVGTSLLLLVPVWREAVWYTHILAMPRTFRRVRHWVAGSPLFTSPPRSGESVGRSYVGAAPFAVEVYYVDGSPISEPVPGDLVSVTRS